MRYSELSSETGFFFPMNFLMSFNTPPVFILRHSAFQGGIPILTFRKLTI